MRHGVAFAAPIVLSAGLAFLACSSSASRSGFLTSSSFPMDAAVEASDNGGPRSFADGQAPCPGLDCKRVVCSDGKKTTLTGKVYDPAGQNPLYNVMVYIPGGLNGDAPLPPITSGASCETCASSVVNPMMSTLTNTKGEFVLEDVPVDKDVPIVVQIGKWRRKFTIDITKGCEENKVPDRDFRLPRNGSEGDMPQIAVTAGQQDALECLLRGIGIDDSEFVPGADPSGHVHIYLGYGGAGLPGSPRAGGSKENPFGGELWNDKDKMMPYDMVLLSCEGDEYNDNKGDTASGARRSMYDYANAGGRVFATHFHYTWFQNSSEDEWRRLGTFVNFGPSAAAEHDINMSFPKGQALAEWLLAVRASRKLGKIDLTNVRASVSRINPPTQSWITQNDAVRYFSFNTPVSAAADQQCGRVVYSDLHVMGGGGESFPQGCPAAGTLNPAQTALEFMFFDLANCVQSDQVVPQPPK